MSESTRIYYCEWCKKDTPHLMSGSGRKIVCEACGMFVRNNLKKPVRIFPGYVESENEFQERINGVSYNGDY